MQFQADIIQQTIIRSKNIESTALGAGMLAGLGIGFWSHPKELQTVRSTDRIFTAEMADVDRLALLKAWKIAVKQAKLI